jgi:DNA-binding MarR family transcriptional regulator
MSRLYRPLRGQASLQRSYTVKVCTFFNRLTELIVSPNNNDSNADAYAFSEQVGHLLRKVYQRHMAIFQQNVGDSQLTAVQFVTLCAVRDRGPSSLTELVKATAVDQATIRGIVERLKARDLITLEPDPEDRRKVIVGLSDSGRLLVEETVPHAARISELTLSNLNPGERVAMLYLLRKMLDDKDE